MNLEQEAKFDLLILSLQARLRRIPTEDEVISFIYGDAQTREAIWNEKPFEVSAIPGEV